MTAAKSGPVTGTQDNVIYCRFGATAQAGGAADTLDDALIGIRAAIAQINSAVSETLSVHAEAAMLERDAAQLLLKALDSMDIVAFQSRILLAGAAEQRSGDEGLLATSLWRFVAAGAAVSERLQALVGEHRSWIGTEERVLRELATQAEQLETTAADCIRTMRTDVRHSDATC